MTEWRSSEWIMRREKVSIGRGRKIIYTEWWNIGLIIRWEEISIGREKRIEYIECVEEEYRDVGTHVERIWWMKDWRMLERYDREGVGGWRKKREVAEGKSKSRRLDV